MKTHCVDIPGDLTHLSKKVLLEILTAFHVELNKRGFALVCFAPSELKKAHPTKVEDRLIESGWDVINDLQ